jgi:AcrR family transcriptional regulator
LAAAKRVCVSKGFGRAKIADVAREAELSVGTIYLYFKKKDELFAALSVRVLKHLNVRLWRARARKDLTFEQSLDVVKKALLEIYEIDPHMFLTLANLQASETLANITLELQRKIVDLLHQSFDIISQVLREGLETERPHAAAPAKLSLILWALFSGLVLWEESKRSLDPRKDHFKSTLNVAFEVFARGIVAH